MSSQCCVHLMPWNPRQLHESINEEKSNFSWRHLGCLNNIVWYLNGSSGEHHSKTLTPSDINYNVKLYVESSAWPRNICCGQFSYFKTHTLSEKKNVREAPRIERAKWIKLIFHCEPGAAFYPRDVRNLRIHLGRGENVMLKGKLEIIYKLPFTFAFRTSSAGFHVHFAESICGKHKKRILKRRAAVSWMRGDTERFNKSLWLFDFHGWCTCSLRRQK